MVFTKEWEDNLYVCPRCDHHDRVGPKVRFDAHFLHLCHRLSADCRLVRDWMPLRTLLSQLIETS